MATDNSEALGKCLRRTQRKAAGEELGPAPVNRCVVNVGTAIESPSRQWEVLTKGRSVVI